MPWKVSPQVDRRQASTLSAAHCCQNQSLGRSKLRCRVSVARRLDLYITVTRSKNDLTPVG
eukprot:4959864-Pyramimonas_sp.AAC.1